MKIDEFKQKIKEDEMFYREVMDARFPAPIPPTWWEWFFNHTGYCPVCGGKIIMIHKEYDGRNYLACELNCGYYYYLGI